MIGFTVPQNFEEACELVRQSRQGAYTAEADSIYFQVQRGEAEHEDWLNKIEEIKTRFPYPDKSEFSDPIPDPISEPTEE